MEWANGYSASYHGNIVDPETWADGDRIELVDGSVSREVDDLRQSADVSIDQRFESEMWVRLYLDATQSGDKERVALFTGLMVSPERNIDGYREEFNYECYSVLKPCDDIYLARGWYVPASISCANIVKSLLSATPAPCEIAPDMPALTTAIVAEENETNLTMVDKILYAVGWTMTVSGDGTIIVAPPTNDVVISLDAVDNDILLPAITVKDDWFSAPNVFRAISDDLTAVARDDTGNTQMSVEGRGREVWAQETSVDLADNESIAEYAMRRLKEEQNKKKEVSYTRRFLPDVDVGALVRLHYPAQDINGIFKVVSQKFNLGFNCETSEEVIEQ